MKASSLDLLEKSELPPAQARAILQVMESELSVHDGIFATKADIAATKADIAAAKADLELKIEGLRTDMQGMRTEMQTVRADLLRWNFAFWVGQLAAGAALFELLK